MFLVHQIPMIFKTNRAATILLRLLKANAITMPWGRAYFLPAEIKNRSIRRHEVAHLRQIRALGPLTFSARYLWYWAKYGYWWNPFEIAARIFDGSHTKQNGYDQHPLGEIIAVTLRRR